MLVVAVAQRAHRERGLGVLERDRRRAGLGRERAARPRGWSSAWRASPSERSAMCSSASSSISRSSPPSPRVSSVSARSQQLPQVVRVERLEPEQRRAAEQRGGQREVGVLGGGADEDEQAVLDVREQRVLLGLVEAVHLVEEEDRALAALAEPVASPARRPRGRPSRPRSPRSWARTPCRSRPRSGGRSWSCRCPGGPQRITDDSRSPSMRARSGRPGREQVALTDDLVERAGPQPGRERSTRTAAAPPPPPRTGRAIARPYAPGHGPVATA